MFRSTVLRCVRRAKLELWQWRDCSSPTTCCDTVGFTHWLLGGIVGRVVMIEVVSGVMGGYPIPLPLLSSMSIRLRAKTP